MSGSGAHGRAGAATFNAEIEAYAVSKPMPAAVVVNVGLNGPVAIRVGALSGEADAWLR